MVMSLGLGCQGAGPGPAPAAQAPGAASADSPKRAASPKKEFSFGQLRHALPAGQADGQVSFTIEPGPGLKINPEYPWRVSLTQPAQGVSLPKQALSREDLDISADRAIVPVALQAVASGEHTIVASVNLSVCETSGAKRCLWFTDEPVTLTLTSPSQGASHE